MKNKLKYIIVVVVVVTIILLELFIDRGLTKEDKNVGFSQYDWINHFEDVESLVRASDIIIRGTKVDSFQEQRVDMIFTKEVIEVDKVYGGEIKEGEKIEILQTGGELNHINTEAAPEAPILDKKENYLLFLQNTPEGHYLILGGYQGVGKIKNNKVQFNVVNDKVTSQLKNKNLSEIEQIILSYIQDSNTAEKIYCYDTSKEWDASEYEKKYGFKLNYFSSPIQSPYQYTYQCESNDMTIDEIAYELGTIMMKDLMQEYEGKTFVVTEYKNLFAFVMNEEEFVVWEERFRKLGKHVILEENQWLCTFTCEFKYTGIFSGIGEMPPEWEWMDTLLPDGSGEDYVYIIQKINDDDYLMRALPKTVIEIKQD